MKHRHRRAVKRRRKRGLIPDTAPQTYKNPYPNLQRKVGTQKIGSISPQTAAMCTELPIPPGVQRFRELKCPKQLFPK